MWPNIHKISLLDETPSVIEKLSRTSERFNASYFFASHNPFNSSLINIDKDYQLQVKSWLIWAAIVALPNPSSDDPLQKDLEDRGLAKKWEASQERQELYDDPLIAILLELRNYEVHFELRTGVVGNFQPFVGADARPNEETKKIDLGEYLYIAPIDYMVLSQTRNIKSGKTKVNVNMVDWFNRQIATWPAMYILGQARERYGVLIAEFLKNNGIV